jgi:hypothetical protein
VSRSAEHELRRLAASSRRSERGHLVELGTWLAIERQARAANGTRTEQIAAECAGFAYGCARREADDAEEMERVATEMMRPPPRLTVAPLPSLTPPVAPDVEATTRAAVDAVRAYERTELRPTVPARGAS